MSYRIKLTLDIACEDNQAAEDEIDWLADYVSDRLNEGADMQRIVQAMVEALVELSDINELMGAEGNTIH
jgi:hypothetical protein